jgi:hypothetical protein
LRRGTVAFRPLLLRSLDVDDRIGMRG